MKKPPSWVMMDHFRILTNQLTNQLTTHPDYLLILFISTYYNKTLIIPDQAINQPAVFI